MLHLLIAAAVTVVGGFSYRTVPIVDRTKPIPSAPAGYPATWKEHVETIAGTAPADRAFNAFVRRRAIDLQRDYYRRDGGADASFATIDSAGTLDVTTMLMAASPDIVSLTMGAGFYQAGMAHGNSDSDIAINWSRRLNRVLTQRDVFARAPDRTLRRIAQARFDNRENLMGPNDRDGIPLSWDRATIGRGGITWWFSAYELGGYLAAGSATVSWRALKPYLRTDLPFSIAAIRDAHD